jgi:hypothetical protein
MNSLRRKQALREKRNLRKRSFRKRALRKKAPGKQPPLHKRQKLRKERVALTISWIYSSIP